MPRNPIPVVVNPTSRVAVLLRSSRLAAGLTQLQLARKAATSQSAIARYEAGVVRPRSDVLERILACLDTVPMSPTRPLIGPVGARALRSRRQILRVLAAHGASSPLVTGAVASAVERDTDPLALAVTASSSTDLAALERDLTAILKHPVSLTDTATLNADSPVDGALLAAARVL